jgi:serine/threonine-protein kinase
MAKVFTITEGLENLGALSTGGQGSVYKAKRMSSVITAVKLLPTPIHNESTDDKHFRDFQNEVAKLKKVNQDPSPNVVKILHSGLTETGSLPFIEMEYIEGPDLQDLLKPPHNPIFTIREATKLAFHLASALAHCHKAGVKHGDIKSNNVKFNTTTGNYVLLDFGLSVMSEEDRRSSLRNAGAVEFMAPEQHNGEMLFQSDVYSYGVVLFELVAGTVPFPLINRNESSRNTVMISHIEKELPNMIGLRRQHLPANWSEKEREQELKVPAWLLQIITRCLEKKPENRFENGVVLYEAICCSNENGTAYEDHSDVISRLKLENERLQALVDKQQRSTKQRTAVMIGLVVLACLLGYFTNYAFKGSRDIKQDSTSVVNKSVPGVVAGQPKAIDSAQKANIDTTKQTPAGQQVPVRKVQKTKDGLVNDVPEF